MKLVKNDIAKIKKSYDKAKEVFDGIKNDGNSVYDFLISQIEAAKADPLNNDNNLDVLGRIIYFKEQSVMANEGDPDFNFDNDNYITNEFCNSFALDEHYLDVAKYCMEIEEYTKYLPDSEFEELDKAVIKEKMHIDFDAVSDLDEQALQAARNDNIARINEEIAAEKEDLSIFSMCGSGLVFDNDLFKKLDTTLTDKKREINSIVGTKNFDDMVNEFNAFEERHDNNLSEAGIMDIEENVETRNQATERIVNEAKDIAAQRIGIYLAAKSKKDSRSLGDKLKHPFRSIKEHFAVKKMEKELKKDYLLTDKNLSEIKSVTDNAGSVNDIGIFKRDNSKMFVTPTAEQIENKRDEIVNEGFEQAMLSEQLVEEMTAPNKEVAEFKKENEIEKVNNLDKSEQKDDIKVD